MLESMSDDARLRAELNAARLRIAELESTLARSPEFKQNTVLQSGDNRKWRLILEDAARLGVSVDTDGRILYANPQFLKLTGWSEQEVLGHDWFATFLPSGQVAERRADFRAMLSARRSFGYAASSYDILTRRGERVPVSWTSFLTVDESGCPADVTCLGVVAAGWPGVRRPDPASSGLRPSLTDNLPLSVMAFDRDGLVTYVNRFHLDVFARQRLGREFFSGQSVFNLPGIVTSGIGPKISLLLEGYPFTLESVFVPTLSGGGSGWQSIRGVPLTKGGEVLGGILIREDISRRVTAEQALQEEHRRLRVIADNTFAWEYWKEPGGRYRWVSPSCERVTGLPPDFFTGDAALRIRDLIHPDDRQKWIEHHAQVDAFDPDPQELDFRIIGPEGETRWISHVCKPVYDSEGNYQGRRGCNHDITLRKQDELDLLAAKKAVEETSQAKSEFLANMSHELRTPLNGILGMLQLLQMTGLNTEQEEYCKLAIQSGDRLTKLLSDLLDLSNIEAGRLAFVPKAFDVQETVRQVAELFLPVSRQKGMAVETVCDPDLPRMVSGDPVRLQQVLANLVGNAIKFSTGGTVRIEVSKSLVTKSGAVRILFTVTDSGCGIADATLEGLFQPFVQESRGYARNHQGAGLGLALSKRIVELMGGNMAVESEVEMGTTIYCNIPFKPASCSFH